MEAEKEKTTQIAGIQVEGTFNAQRFFDTLAAMLSHEYGMTITVKVKVEEKDEESTQEEMMKVV